MRLYFGSDHGGVTLRKQLIQWATGEQHQVLAEVGPADEAERVDYPDIAQTLCAQVLADPGSLGVLLCGTGQGVAMSANKIRGIRAAVVVDAYSAQMARAHNDANVLCLGGRVLGLGLATVLLRTFLTEGFEGGRHGVRVRKLDLLAGS